MNCKAVESRLSAYLDGELSGQEMFVLRDHLNHCRNCREEAASLKSLKRMIGSLSCPEPSPDFESRLCTAVMTDRRPRLPFSGFHSAILFAGVAGMAMLVTIQLIGAQSPEVGRVEHPKPEATSTGADFEVRRNEMTSSISDPISGGPIWSAADSR